MFIQRKSKKFKISFSAELKICCYEYTINLIFNILNSTFRKFSTISFNGIQYRINPLNKLKVYIILF